MVVRINLQERGTPLGNKHGEEITLRGILCGKRYFAEVLKLMMTPLGIPLICFVEDSMNSAGDRKNFAGDDLSVATTC